MSLSPQEIDAESERLAALRMQLLEMHPFWGYMLLQVRLIPALELPTLAATDCLHYIWYNPAMTRELSVAELGFVLAHEVCHQVLATVGRRGGREEFKWNLATDYAINAMVAEITVPGESAWAKRLYQLPEGALFNPKYRDWVAEVIYEDLCRKERKEGAVFVELALPNAEGKYLDLPDVSNHQGGIDTHLPMDMNPDQHDVLRERILAAVEIFHANHDRGDLPENILRQAGLLEPPKIPWRRLLHRFADAVLNTDDYSLARPNKHYWIQDMVVPGRYGETVSTIVVALDTSGSMSENELREIAGEIRGIVPNTRDITLIVADCQIQQVIAFDDLEPFLKSGRFRGGGGTDHVCVFDYIAEHKLNPRLFIGLSDLDSNFPIKKPPYPVLWIAPKTHATPPWGKVITL